MRSFSFKTKKNLHLRTAVNVKKPTLAHFAGRATDSDCKIYLRTILENEHHTEIDTTWDIYEDKPGMVHLKNLSQFSYVNINHILYVYGGFYQEKATGEARNLNPYVIEVDLHNLRVYKISKLECISNFLILI